MEVEALLMDDDFLAPSSSSNHHDNNHSNNQQEQDQEQNQGGERVDEQSLQGFSIEELFNVLEDVVPSRDAYASQRAQASQLLLGHLSRHQTQAESQQGGEVHQIEIMAEEEALLQTLSLHELYTVSVGNQDGLFSEYLVHRSRQILDAVLSRNVPASE
jgi:hypothetical protein